MLESIGDDTALLWDRETKHGMRLTTTCLTIGEYCSVVAGQSRLNQRKSCFIVNLALRGVYAVDLVICELFLIDISLLLICRSNNNLLLLFVHMDDLMTFWNETCD